MAVGQGGEVEALQAGAAAVPHACSGVDGAQLGAAVVAQARVLVWGHMERRGFF